MIFSEQFEVEIGEIVGRAVDNALAKIKQPPKDVFPELLSVKLLAKYLNLSESHIRYLVKSEQIPFARVPDNNILFKKSAIDVWFESLMQVTKEDKIKEKEARRLEMDSLIKNQRRR